MTHNNFAVTSLALIICWLANVEATTTREECINLCQTQYLSLRGTVTQLHLETIQFQCQTSCLALPLASTLNTGTGTSSTGNTDSGTTKINKADCLIQCDIDYNAYRGRMTEFERQHLLTTCRESCQSLPSDSDTPKTPAETDTKGSLQQCEHICDTDNERYTKAGELSAKFIDKIWLACHSECFKTYSQSTVNADCQKWAEKLRGMYASEQPDSFLTTLQERAIEACGSGTTATAQ